MAFIPIIGVMTDVHTLLKNVRDYAKRAKLEDTTASLWVFNDGKRLEQLAKGKVSITMRRLLKAQAQLNALEADLKRGIKRNPHSKPKVSEAAPAKKKRSEQRVAA